MFAVRLPMTDTDAATTMDKIVTQIKTRFKNGVHNLTVISKVFINSAIKNCYYENMKKSLK